MYYVSTPTPQLSNTTPNHPTIPAKFPKTQMSNPKTPIPTETPSEYTATLIKLSVTRILKQTGFNSANSTALQTLTRIAALFLHQITASAASNAALSGGIPTLHDVVSAVDDLNFPLDFSIPQLSRFISTTSDNRPFPSLISPPSPQAVVIGCGDVTVGLRGPEVPVWLPEFPDMSNNGDCGSVRDKEVYWEESVESKPEAEAVAEVKAVAEANENEKEKGDRKRKRKRGMGEFMVFGRRERLKFRLGDTRNAKAKAKAGNVDDLKLRNGVCRGGKRIGLGKRVNCNISSFFDDDDKGE